MSSSNDFIQHVSELLAPCGSVTVKRMFGGHGVYLDGLFVAILADDELYLKADELTRADFEAEGCAPFVYTKSGKAMAMSFHRAPGEAMDAPHLMQPWARRALQAALRARAAKTAPGKKTAVGSKPKPAKTPARVAAKRRSRR
jgi:DNA transformation protein and related proteins